MTARSDFFKLMEAKARVKKPGDEGSISTQGADTAVSSLPNKTVTVYEFVSNSVSRVLSIRKMSFNIKDLAPRDMSPMPVAEKYLEIYLPSKTLVMFAPHDQIRGRKKFGVNVSKGNQPFIIPEINLGSLVKEQPFVSSREGEIFFTYPQAKQRLDQFFANESVAFGITKEQEAETRDAFSKLK